MKSRSIRSTIAKALVLPDEASPLEKYHFKPSFGSSHQWAIETLSDVGPETRILDIGAGGGGMSVALKPKSPRRLVAVEPNKTARAALEPLYDVVHAGMEPLLDAVRDNASPNETDQFDVVLLLDVLEHMTEPFDFLRQLDPLLAPGARVVISVPNVAHWSVRFALLFGRFEYTSRGILDRTHFQFFTRKRFLELISAVPETRTETLSASISPFEFLLPAWASQNALYRSLAKIRKSLAEILPGMFAYQHIGVVRRKI